MNNVSIMGRLTADPKVRATANGDSVCTFTVAVKRPRSKDKTDFIRCVAWKGAAEFIEKWFQKGRMIAIQGVLTTRSWKDEAGDTRSMTEVSVDSVFFCGDSSRKPEGAGEKPEAVETYPNAYGEEVPF